MRKFRTYSDVEHSTGSNLLGQVVDQRTRLAERLSRVGTVTAIASGKGGVGKSALTANLAAALALRGREVGALDADLNGPSLARMLGVRTGRLEDREEGIVPPRGAAGVRVMSMELLQGEEDAPLRWRDPGADTFLWQSSMETTALREFLADVLWDGCDHLLIDVPPGVDKIRRLLELVPSLPILVLVTTPSEMARSVVARSVRLARDAGVPHVGLVANMTSYLCPDCGTRRPLFPGDGAVRLSKETGVPIWVDVPFDPLLAEATDRGCPPLAARVTGPGAVAGRGTPNGPELEPEVGPERGAGDGPGLEPEDGSRHGPATEPGPGPTPEGVVAEALDALADRIEGEVAGP